jgi:hypothetical protein
MRQKKLVEQITESVRKGNVKEPFKSNDFSFLSSSRGFLSKHPEYFERVSRGLYKLK